MRRSNRSTRISVKTFARFFWLICMLTGLLSCSDPGEEGGLIGTGLIRGTVSEYKIVVADTVEVKASTGEKTRTTLNRNQQFSIASLPGNPPYLLRTNLGNNDFRYALAFGNATTNLHSYSDVVIRSWFATQGRNIDSEFQSSDPMVDLPTEAQFSELADNIFSVIGIAFSNYAVTGTELLSADYIADNNRIDDYLKNNPVVINGQTVSVLLTDPETDFQTEARSGLSINAAGLATTDTSSPVKVTNVRALGSSLQEIVVVWDPAIDNVGVIGYQIYRDSNLIDTTPFPVYTDTGLQASSSYEYRIVAIDGAGLSSIESDAVIGRTLGGVDNQPPSAPTSVTQRVVSASRVVLLWTVADVSDVVAFNVLRGTNGQTPEPLIKTTSTEVTDPSVSGGTQYCYQIQAIDASGNVSQKSEPFCVNTGGNTVTGGTDATGNSLIIPDVDSLECSATLSDENIRDDITLSEPCYTVNQTITVTTFADLVIPQGTVLKFGEGAGLRVIGTGSLAVNGTPENPVVFTGVENTEGYWRGIWFEFSNSIDNQINNAVIQFAGYGLPASALRVASSVEDRSRLRVTGSVFRYTAGYGVSLGEPGTQIDTFDNNVSIENDHAAEISALILPALGASNSFTGNRDSTVSVPRLSTSSNLIIPDIGVPLVSDGVYSTDANLTIDAGVEMRFQPESSIDVTNGDLFINGVADSPVLLSATDRTPGSWGGVNLERSANSNLKLVTIEYGGSIVATYSANLGLSRSSATVSDVTLRNSSGYGVRLSADSTISGSYQEIDNELQ